MAEHEANGMSLDTSALNHTEHKRSVTSSPSGRSGTPVSVTSDSSRRRIEQDTVKESARSVSPKLRRRRHIRSPKATSQSRTRSRSASLKHSRKRSRSRRRSRSRERDGHHSNGRDRHRSRNYRRSHSPRQYARGNRRNSERDHPKPSRCVGVFGLSTRTREKDLRSEFERYGPLDNIQLIHDHKSGRSRGFGFIYYTYLEDAQKARDGANGMILDDRKIRVDFSITDRNRSPPRRERHSRSTERRRRSRSSIRD